MSAPEQVLIGLVFLLLWCFAYALGRVHQKIDWRQRLMLLGKYDPRIEPQYAPRAATHGISEGYVRKGGQNPPPTDEQIANRPAPPARFRSF